MGEVIPSHPEPHGGGRMMGRCPEHTNQLLPGLISRGGGGLYGTHTRRVALQLHLFSRPAVDKYGYVYVLHVCGWLNRILRSTEELPFQQLSLRSQIPAVRREGVLVYQPPLLYI